MNIVGTTEAAKLLRICVQRVKQLLYEGRIKGAKKVGRFWKIPLYGKKPKVAKGSRGPKGNWTKRIRAATIIHVNQLRIRSNRKNGKNEPVVRVQRGSKATHYHEIEINGRCKVVYRKKPLGCGASVWLEVEPYIEIIPCSS
ncbi:MAG: helix-turn-helix domain-containing protein [Rivularia sp. ALOHA_DT_140]|nr:helix-turn-helix domain-containing protein [Rivularia sp. ALOHA_DT_140]